MRPNDTRLLCLIGVTVLLASLLDQRPVRGDGVVRDGLGAISIGRGGTNIAHFDNGVILLDNPAGMMHVPCCGLAELSFDTLLTDLHYADPDNSVDGEVKPYPMPQLAYIRKSAAGDWAAGIGIFAPAGFGAEYDVFHPVLGMQRQKSFGALVKILPGVAYQLTDQLSIGAAVGVAASHVELEGPFHLQSGPLPGAPALLDVQSSGAAVAWNIGLQYMLNECTVFGLAMNGETRMSLDGTAVATVPGLGQSRFEADVNMTWPRSVGAGLAYSPWENRRFSADVIWYDWSHAFTSVDLSLSNASNPAFTGVLGSVFQDRFPLNWHDSVSIRTGYEHFVTDCTVFRAGYIYHRNPVPESTLTPYIPAILEHAASIGYGWRLADWNLDLAYQFSWGRPRTVGTSSFVGGDFDNSRVEAAAHWMSISFVRMF